MPISGHAELQLGIRPLDADYLSPIPCPASVLFPSHPSALSSYGCASRMASISFSVLFAQFGLTFFINSICFENNNL